MSFPTPRGVLCAGNICYDFLLGPVEEFHWNRTNWVERFREDMGGNGSNTAFAMARLGVRARLLGKVGQDRHGGTVLEKLTGAGVDCSLVGRSQAATTATVVLVNAAGDRQFVQHIGASQEVFEEPFEFSPDVCSGISHYHQANIFALPNLRRHSGEQMRRAKAAGLATSVDTGWATDGKWEQVLRPALEFCDLFFTNEDEGRAATGEREPAAIAQRFLDWGAGAVLIKLGARGCAVYQEGKEERIEGFRIEAVDTTGAGDCFAAGVFAALSRGYSLTDAARVGNAVGAMVVSQLGATTGVADWDRTLQWIRRAEESSPK